MKKKTSLVVLLLAFVLLLGGASVLYSRLSQSVATDQLATQTPEYEEHTGETQSGETNAIPAPDFTVYTADGTEVRLSDFRGTPVVLNFWATWCGYCKKEMPDFNEVCAELDGAVQFLMVNVTVSSQETLEKASAYVEEEGFTFPVFYDTTGEATHTYGAYSLPTTFFIDSEGNLVTYAAGAINRDVLMQAIDLCS